jgi:hypothetical protein
VVPLPPRIGDWQSITQQARSRRRRRALQHAAAVTCATAVCIAVVTVAVFAARHPADRQHVSTLDASPTPTTTTQDIPPGLPSDAQPFPPDTSLQNSSVAIVPVSDQSLARISKARAIEIFHTEADGFTDSSAAPQAQLVELYSSVAWVGESANAFPAGRFHDVGLYWLVSVPTDISDIPFAQPKPSQDAAGSDTSQICLTQVPIDATTGKPAEIMQGCAAAPETSATP